MIILVRHALAVPRANWTGEDAKRPLTSRGDRQAAGLAGLLKTYPAEALISSPSLRCTATLKPTADQRGEKVKTSRALREGRSGHAVDLVLDSVGDVILCTHGDVVDDVLRALRHLGWPVHPRPPKAKGSAWLLSRDRCDYLPPPT